MSALFENAVISIRLGIEDFETGEDDRMISAVRNYYAGILLLAKECLVRAAPNADPLKVIGAKMKPISDGTGGVAIDVVGWKTAEFSDMKGRFKDFNLKWPDGDLDKLRKLRNEAEHHHLTQPVAALAEAIASSFPMVVDFFDILGEDPKNELDGAWDVILEKRTAFEKVQRRCLGELKFIRWPRPVERLDRMACENCGSSLIGQEDPANNYPESFHAKCAQCGEVSSVESSIRMLVKASFEVDDYIAAKDGAEPVINDCPECAISGVYVQDGEVNVCFACGFALKETCFRCGNGITLDEYTILNNGLCGYCSHISEKVMRE